MIEYQDARGFLLEAQQLLLVATTSEPAAAPSGQPAVMLHPCTTSSFKANINRGGRWLRPWRRCSELLPVG